MTSSDQTKILNYSTSIEAFKTVGEIQGILAQNGARKVMTEFGPGGTIEALSFTIITPNRLELAIRLPIKPDAVLAVMHKQKIQRSKITREQAVRVAWRIAKSWLLAQMAFIQTEQVSLEQIFLSYIVTGTGETVYERMIDSHFLLGEGKCADLD